MTGSTTLPKRSGILSYEKEHLYQQRLHNCKYKIQTLQDHIGEYMNVLQQQQQKLGTIETELQTQTSEIKEYLKNLKLFTKLRDKFLQLINEMYEIQIYNAIYKHESKLLPCCKGMVQYFCF